MYRHHSTDAAVYYSWEKNIKLILITFTILKWEPWTEIAFGDAVGKRLTPVAYYPLDGTHGNNQQQSMLYRLIEKPCLIYSIL